jgi:hypothetical protein
VDPLVRLFDGALRRARLEPVRWQEAPAITSVARIASCLNAANQLVLSVSSP